MRRTGAYCSQMHELLSKNGRYIHPFTVDEDAASLVTLRRAHYLEPNCPVEEIPEKCNVLTTHHSCAFVSILLYLMINLT
jgi:hypothetical protein